MAKLPWLRLTGIIGGLLALVLYVHEPSFLTPDKILVFLTLVFMALGQGGEFFKRLAPFAILLLVYESFRGLADSLNTHVNFNFMITVDKWLGFGRLPTHRLQHWLWQGQVQWYDFGLYLFYMLHFVLPFVLAIVIWKLREKQYWRYNT